MKMEDPVVGELLPTRTFQHRTDFDTNGLLYHLATVGGHRWMNPAQQGMVELSSSSLSWRSDALLSVVGRRPATFVTKSAPGAWIAVNLRTVQLQLTHYSLRHIARCAGWAQWVPHKPSRLCEAVMATCSASGISKVSSF